MTQGSKLNGSIQDSEIASLAARLQRQTLLNDLLATEEDDTEMAIRPVRQSVSKDEFLKSLNLDLSQLNDRQVFSTMWEEVTHYWVQNFETSSRDILKNEYRANPGVRQPYKWAHLNQEAIDRAISQIWSTASEKSRWYYDHGQSAEPSVKNWVLKWLLWHVARYRDERNNKKNRSSGSSSPGSPLYSPIPGTGSQISWILDQNGYWTDIHNYSVQNSLNSSSATSPVASAFSPEVASLTPSVSGYSEEGQPIVSSTKASSCSCGPDGAESNDDQAQEAGSSTAEYWKTVMNAKPSSEQDDKDTKGRKHRSG